MEAAAVAFDKDGTLIDFDALWGPAALGWARALAAEANAAEVARELAEEFRFDPVTGSAIPDGPLAVAIIEDLRKLATTVIVRHGVPSAQARRLVRHTISTADGLIQPKGDVAGTWARLKESGLGLGIVTGDDRAATLRAVKALGIAGLVDGLVCGDDGVPAKPHPGALEALGETMGVSPGEMVMVGDTAADLAGGAGRRSCRLHRGEGRRRLAAPADGAR